MLDACERSKAGSKSPVWRKGGRTTTAKPFIIFSGLLLQGSIKIRYAVLLIIT